jgi:hypothetical protein
MTSIITPNIGYVQIEISLGSFEAKSSLNMIRMGSINMVMMRSRDNKEKLKRKTIEFQNGDFKEMTPKNGRVRLKLKKDKNMFGRIF